MKPKVACSCSSKGPPSSRNITRLRAAVFTPAGRNGSPESAQDTSFDGNCLDASNDESDAVSDTTFDVGGLFVTTAFSELHESAEVVLTSAT